MSELPNGQLAEYENFFEQELVALFLSDRLHLILLPTERCNFRCTYCYEDFSIERMSSATIHGVKRFIDRRLNGAHNPSPSDD